MEITATTHYHKTMPLFLLPIQLGVIIILAFYATHTTPLACYKYRLFFGLGVLFIGFIFVYVVDIYIPHTDTPESIKVQGHLLPPVSPIHGVGTSTTTPK